MKIKRSNLSPIKKSTYFLSIFIILLPVSTALSGLVGSISFENYVAIAYLLFSIIEICIGRYIRFEKSCWAIYIYMAYSLLTCLWNKWFSFNYYYTTFLISFAILVCATCQKYTYRELDCILKSFSLSTIVVIIVTLININHTYAGRIVIRITSTMDPNDFGCGTCIIFALLLVKFSGGNKLLSAMGSLGILVSIVLTGSRGALLMCVTEVITWIIIFGKSGKLKNVVLVFFIFVAVYFFSFNLSTELLTRFSFSDVLASGGTGRMGIWRAAIVKYIHSDFFHTIFGYGHGAFPQAVNYYGGLRTYPYEAHNMYVNAIIEGGLIGFFLLLLSLKQSIKQSIKNRNYVGLIGLIGFMTTGLSLDTQSYRIFPMAFYVAMVFNNPFFVINRSERFNES